MHPQARNSRSQTGTPGASRTQSVAGGHRESAVHTVRRVPLVAPLPSSPAVPLGFPHYVELIDSTFRDVGGVD